MSSPITSHPSKKLWSPDFPQQPKRWPFFYGWVIVCLSTIGVCISMPGQTIGVSVFTDRLTEALGVTRMQLSVAYMLGTLLSALGLSSGGRFFDLSGARKALVGSIFFLGLTLLGLSGMALWSAWLGRLPFFAQIPWLAPCVVLTVGFALLRFSGQGMVTMSSRAMLGKWFNRRRGSVTAISGAIVSFAFSGAPIGFEYLIRSYGWQGAWFAMGAVFVVIAVPLFWIFARDNPEECGLEMDGGFVASTKRANPDSVFYRDFTLSEARRSLAFWAFTFMFGLNALVVTAYAFHIISVGQELAVSTDYILGLFIPSAGVSVVAGFVIAWLTDQSFVRIKYLLCLMAVSSGVGFFTLALGDYPHLQWLHILGFGISGGCFGSLSSIVYPRFFGRQHLGAISGQFMTVIVVSSAVGPFFFTCIEASFGAYRAGFFVSGCVAALLAFCGLWADNPQRKLGV